MAPDKLYEALFVHGVAATVAEDKVVDYRYAELAEAVVQVRGRIIVVTRGRRQAYRVIMREYDLTGARTYELLSDPAYIQIHRVEHPLAEKAAVDNAIPVVEHEHIELFVGGVCEKGL